MFTIYGPIYWLLEGKTRNTLDTAEYLMCNGASPFPRVIMTPNAFLTDEAWKTIVPLLIKGMCLQVQYNKIVQGL